jgi:hypothetical protein
MACNVSEIAYSSRKDITYSSPSSRHPFCYTVNDAALCSIQSGLIKRYLMVFISVQAGARRWNIKDNLQIHQQRPSELLLLLEKR